MRRALLVLTALLAQPAAACPTIATGTPSQLSFDTAQVVLTHVDGRTTFSVSPMSAAPSTPMSSPKRSFLVTVTVADADTPP